MSRADGVQSGRCDVKLSARSPLANSGLQMMHMERLPHLSVTPKPPPSQPPSRLVLTPGL
jgi:hypothetical protein